MSTLPKVDKCCGCVTDLKAASAIIAVYAIVTSPAITWAVVRHAYVIRLSCYITTNSTRPDIVDINLNHILSFGFGANAGLGPSCLGPYTDPVSLSAIKDPAKSQYVLVVKHIGWIVLLADIIFLLFSIHFLIKLFKKEGNDKSNMTIERNESTDRTVSNSQEPNTEASLPTAEKPTDISSNILPAVPVSMQSCCGSRCPRLWRVMFVNSINVWENRSPASSITIERKSRHSNKRRGFHSRIDEAPKLATAPGRGAAKLFIIAAIVAICMSFIYTILYVSACMTVGGSFPIFEFFFSIIDVLVWIYFLIVVNSYRLTLE